MEPPCKFALVVFLATLGEAPGIAVMNLSESSWTSMTSKLSWLAVLVDFFMVVPLELLDRGRGWDLVFGTCAAGELDVPATCLAFLICSRRTGRADPVGLRISAPLALELRLLFVELSSRFGTSFQTSFVVRLGGGPGLAGLPSDAEDSEPVNWWWSWMSSSESDFRSHLHWLVSAPPQGL